jgi:hypothetical protein
MKIKDYNQMMRYLTSTGEFTRNRGVPKQQGMKNKFIEHRQKLGDVIRNQKDNKVTVMNRVKEKVREEDISERIARMHHIYDGGPKPKHMDNPTIKTTEEMQKIKPIKQPKKAATATPLKIDFSGIDANIRAFEEVEKPASIAPKTVKKKSEGLAYLLNIDE